MRFIVTDRVAWTVCLSSVGRSVTLVSRAKTAEPTEMRFGLRTRVAQGPHLIHGHVLDGFQIPHGKRQLWEKEQPL